MVSGKIVVRVALTSVLQRIFFVLVVRHANGQRKVLLQAGSVDGHHAHVPLFPKPRGRMLDGFFCAKNLGLHSDLANARKILCHFDKMPKKPGQASCAVLFVSQFCCFCVHHLPAARIHHTQPQIHKPRIHAQDQRPHIFF